MSVEQLVPRRLYPLRYNPEGHRLSTDQKRFRVVPAGRRSGKTERAKRHVSVCAMRANNTPWDDPRFFAAAPTRDQANSIYWKDLKAMLPPIFIRSISESRLSITLENNAELHVLGMDKPERVEGSPWDGGILDEYANMKKRTWGEHVRPALSDRKGWCWLIGVPEGRNHYYDLYKYAISGVDPEWDGYTWPSIEVLDPEEVAAARRQLDELVFKQEYEASFVNFEGRAYYPFSEDIHCTNKLVYNPRASIGFCFDFNVAPGVAAVVQEQPLPGQYEKSASGAALLDRPIVGTGVIGEVYIPRNSNTEAVCRKLIELYGDHAGYVELYGDATGGARGSAKVAGSDWDIIKRELGAHFGHDRIINRVPHANPAERSRVNALNTRLLNGMREVRLMVDPAKAPHVVVDLEGVRTLEGGSGELDKQSDPNLTHISDALGYYVVKQFPIHNNGSSVEALHL